ADLATQSKLYWGVESGSGVACAVSAVIAVRVGLFIRSQTCRGAVLAQLRELAALRALGVGAAKLRGFVVEQALWVAVMGVAVMAAMPLALWCLSRVVHVALSFPAW